MKTKKCTCEPGIIHKEGCIHYICPNCGMDKRIRNPSGGCDHLYLATDQDGKSFFDYSDKEKDEIVRKAQEDAIEEILEEYGCKICHVIHEFGCPVEKRFRSLEKRMDKFEALIEKDIPGITKEELDIEIVKIVCPYCYESLWNPDCKLCHGKGVIKE